MTKINRTIGGIVVAVTVLLLSFTLVDNLTDAFGKETYRVTGTFSNVGGLTLEAPVQIGGVIIGNVEKIRFTADGQVHVILKLHLRRPIPVDSVMAIAATTVSGDVFVNLFRGNSREMIQRITGEGDLPRLRAVDMYSLSDLGGSFAKVGEAVGQTVDNIAKLIGKDAHVLEDISAIQVNGKVIREQTALIADRFAEGERRYGELGDRMLGLIDAVGRYSELAERNFPPERRQETAMALASTGAELARVQEYCQRQSPAMEAVENNVARISAWVKETGFSPRSVVGVLLSDPEYSAAATVAQIKAAYYSVFDRTLLAKIAFFARHYMHARGVVGDFSEENSQRWPRLDEFYRAWLRHESREKAACGYISRGRSR